MDVRTGGPVIHGIFCTLAGILFVAFFVTAAAGPSWWGDGAHFRYSPSAGLALTLIGIAILFQIVLGIWVGLDANRRGMNGFLWGGLTCFTCVVGLLVYLLSVQSVEDRAGGHSPAMPDGSVLDDLACPNCGSPIQPDYLACPHCGTSLPTTCPQCAQPVEVGWSYCARCKASLAQGAIDG